jgi:hypothetical protein
VEDLPAHPVGVVLGEREPRELRAIEKDSRQSVGQSDGVNDDERSSGVRFGAARVPR